MLGAEIADRLYAEAEQVAIRADHAREQGDGDFAVVLAQVEFGLVLVAHVLNAVHGDDELTDGDEGGDE